MAETNQEYMSIPKDEYEKLCAILKNMKASVAESVAGMEALVARFRPMWLGAPAGIVQKKGRYKIKYAAYNFKEGKCNCTHYFGKITWHSEDLLRKAKEIFEKENLQWELIEIRSMRTTERTSKHFGVYPKVPRPSKDGTKNAVQFVAKHKLGELVESAWLFQDDYVMVPDFGGNGLHDCAADVRDSSGFRRAVAASLEFEYARTQRAKGR